MSDSLTRNMYKAVDVLHDIAPDRLAALGARNPLYKELLSPGLGPIEGNSKERAQQRLVLETWSEALGAEIERCEKITSAAQRDLGRARWIELSTTIASSLAGSTLIAMISGGAGTKGAQIVVAVIALCCSGASAVTVLMRRTVLNTDRAKAYAELLKSVGEAKVVMVHLQVCARTGVASDDEILKKVESLLGVLQGSVV